MAAYQRKTVLPPAKAFGLAADILQNVFNFSPKARAKHEVTFRGGEGEVTFEAHRHGPYTVVTATTDCLRTSRLDYEVQRILSWMPYEPGDHRGPEAEDLTPRSATHSMWRDRHWQPPA